MNTIQNSAALYNVHCKDPIIPDKATLIYQVGYMMCYSVYFI